MLMKRQELSANLEERKRRTCGERPLTFWPTEASTSGARLGGPARAEHGLLTAQPEVCWAIVSEGPAGRIPVRYVETPGV